MAWRLPRRFVRFSALAAGVVLTLTATSACGGGGGGSEPAATSTTATSLTPTTTDLQRQFHPELLEAVRRALDILVPDRFTLDEKSVRLIDFTKGEVRFTTQKAIGEFARSQGVLGLGAADFCANNCFEYWGIITWAFQSEDGARATFERFPDAENIVIDDAAKVNTQGEAYGGGYLGNLTVETYQSADGVSTLFLRGSLVDGNAIHYVSAVVDVPPGQTFDGLGEIRRVMRGLQDIYPKLLAEYLRIGGTDEAPTTTTKPEGFVPGSAVPGEG